MQKKINDGLFSLVYFGCLFLIDGIWKGLGIPALKTETLAGSLAVNAVFKGTVWVLPVLLILKQRGSNLRWPLKELASWRIPWRLLIPWCCLMAVALWSIRLYVYGDRILFSRFQPVFLAMAIYAGVTEELTFRGFLLNLQLRKWRVSTAVIINALCFLLIHYSEVLLGLPISSLLCGRGVLLFILGAAFSYMMIRSGNLVVPILMHTLWDMGGYLLGLY